MVNDDDGCYKHSVPNAAEPVLGVAASPFTTTVGRKMCTPSMTH